MWRKTFLCLACKKIIGDTFPPKIGATIINSRGNFALRKNDKRALTRTEYLSVLGTDQCIPLKWSQLQISAEV